MVDEKRRLLAVQLCFQWFRERCVTSRYYLVQNDSHQAGIPFFDTPKIGRKDDIRVLVPMITKNMWEASLRVTIE